MSVLDNDRFRRLASSYTLWTFEARSVHGRRFSLTLQLTTRKCMLASVGLGLEELFGPQPRQLLINKKMLHYINSWVKSMYFIRKEKVYKIIKIWKSHVIFSTLYKLIRKFKLTLKYYFELNSDIIKGSTYRLIFFKYLCSSTDVTKKAQFYCLK